MPIQNTRADLGVGKKPTFLNSMSKDGTLTSRRVSWTACTWLSAASPTNFKVTCSDSIRTQRASGANPLTLCTYFPIRERISSGMSSPIKMRMLHQLAAEHVQGLCGRPIANPLPVAGESTLHDFGLDAIRQSVKHQTHRFFLSASGRARDSSDANSK